MTRNGRESVSRGQAPPLDVAALRALGTVAPAGRVPDFFIVGHPKCGTTALYEMVKRHPRIYMPSLKEPQFLASEMHVPPRPQELPRTLDEYLALFDDARPDQLVGEASTSYLRSHTAAAHIAEVQPDARIIAILREPASLLRSVHLQYVQAVMETEYDLRRALALEEERRQGRSLPRHGLWPLSLRYSDHVRYVEQLHRYHATFGTDNVLVLIYEDFRADNESTVSAVLRFLEVDDSLPLEEIEANFTVGPRSQAVHELMHTVTVGRGPISRGVKAVIKALTPEETRRRVLQGVRRSLVYGAPPAEDAELMVELRSRFKGEVEALSEYLGRDLVGLWGYDDID
jgi:Sulfotransferase domain